MEEEFWKYICRLRRVYLVFGGLFGGLLLIMIFTLPLQQAGSDSEAITILNIGILSIGVAMALGVYYWCSEEKVKSLDRYDRDN
jgi:hypothetical protein